MAEPVAFQILSPNIHRKILDKVVVVDKGSAKVNAPLPLHGNHY
jgi:hypothetical protein